MGEFTFTFTFSIKNIQMSVSLREMNIDFSFSYFQILWNSFQPKLWSPKKWKLNTSKVTQIIQTQLIWIIDSTSLKIWRQNSYFRWLFVGRRQLWGDKSKDMVKRRLRRMSLWRMKWQKKSSSLSERSRTSDQVSRAVWRGRGREQVGSGFDLGFGALTILPFFRWHKKFGVEFQE